ncbi:hypothetical protein ACLOJK_034634 [Asimina triloba]
MTSNAMGDRGWKDDAVLIWDAAEMGACDLELMIGHSLIVGPPDDARIGRNGLEQPWLPCFEDDGAPYLGAPMVYLDRMHMHMQLGVI